MMKRAMFLSAIVLAVCFNNRAEAQLTNLRIDTIDQECGHFMHHIAGDSVDYGDFIDFVTDYFESEDESTHQTYASGGGGGTVTVGGAFDGWVLSQVAWTSQVYNSFSDSPQTNASIGRVGQSIIGSAEGKVWWNPGGSEYQAAYGYSKYELIDELEEDETGELDIQLDVLVASNLNTAHEVDASSDFGPPGFDDYTAFYVADEKVDAEGNVDWDHVTWIYGCWTGNGWHVWSHFEQGDDEPIDDEDTVPDLSAMTSSFGYRNVQLGDMHQHKAYIWMYRGGDLNPKIEDNDEFNNLYGEATSISVGVSTTANP